MIGDALDRLKSLIGRCLLLPGHFEGPVAIEAARLLGSGVELRVRLTTGELDEAVLGAEDVARLLDQQPGGPGERRAGEPTLLVGYLPFEFGSRGPDAEREALDYFEKCGSRPREYRNGLVLAVPGREQIETLRRSVQYLLAIEQVRSRSRQLNLTDSQKDELREREATERGAAESAFLRLYGEVWLLRAQNDGFGAETISIGGRPLSSTLDEKKRALVHQRVMELLTLVQQRVFGVLVPSKIVELFKLGDGDPPRLGLRTTEIVDGFYSFLGFTRLVSAAVIRRAIAQGVEKRVFGYTTGVPTLGPGARYQIDAGRLAFDRALSEDEVDLDSGFLIVPEALPQTAASGPTTVTTSGGPMTAGPDGPPSSPGPGPRRTVDLALTADRNQLFNAWNALANLADMAGTVTLTVPAESSEGFDARRLDNAVLEPFRESGLLPD